MAKKTLSSSDFVTMGNISKYCMVHPTTVRRWIKSKKLHATRLPSGHFRVTTQELRKFSSKNHIPIPADLLNNSQKSN